MSAVGARDAKVDVVAPDERLSQRGGTPALLTLLTIVIVMVCFSSHLFAMAYAAGVPAALVKALILVKDLLAAAALGLALWQADPRHRRSVLIALCALAVLTLPAAILGFSRYTPDDVIISARGLVIPIVAAATGLLLPHHVTRVLLRRAVVLIAAGAAYALIEYFLPRAYLADVIQVGRYWVDVKGSRNSFSTACPAISSRALVPGACPGRSAIR